MTISHLVITDVDERGDPIHASSVVIVLAGAGHATPLGRSVKRTPRKPRETIHAIRKTWGNVIAEPLRTWRRPMSARRWRRWPWRQAGLKPYWGKPAVRNFRRGGRNEVQGLMAICHDAPKC